MIKAIHKLLLLSVLLAACRGAQPKLPATQEQLERWVRIQISGAEAFEFETLEGIVMGELFLFRKGQPRRSSVDDAAYALRLFYLSHGYRLAEVEYEIDQQNSALSLDQEADPLGVRFLVTEGLLTSLHAVEFVGAPSLKGSTLRSFFGVDEKRKPFVRAELEGALRDLRDYYLELGFRDARVSLGSLRFDEERGRAYVQVVVEEGTGYRLGAVSSEGELPVELNLQALARPYLGQAFTPRLGFRLRGQILDRLARAGYPRAEVQWQTSMDASSGEVGLRFEVQAGTLVRVKAVILSGNKETRSSTIRARLPVRPGDLYNAAKIQEGLRQLYATGLFEAIRIDLGEDDNLRIKLVENSSLELRVEPGWGSYEGPRLNVILDERNFLGTARRASLSAHVSALATGSRLSFFEPRVFGTRTDASFSFFADKREEPSFNIENIGFDMVFRRRLNRRMVASVGYEFRFNELKEVDVLVQDPEDLAEPNVGLVALNLTYSDRDDLLLPTRGSQARLRVELAEKALGSELDFLRNSLEWTQLWKLGEQDGLALSARAVWVHTLQGERVLPLQERVFLGGENSVRSFSEDDLGPLDPGGQALGGEASSFLSMEWRHELAGNFSSALFFDAGNVVPDVEDFLHFDDFRFGLGVGLRYALPIGPLRLDLGFNPATREQEDEFVLHFSVGYAY